MRMENAIASISDKHAEYKKYYKFLLYCDFGPRVQVDKDVTFHTCQDFAVNYRLLNLSMMHCVWD